MSALSVAIPYVIANVTLYETVFAKVTIIPLGVAGIGVAVSASVCSVVDGG